jgi:acyl-CoA synthetase (NDP forming)
VAEAQGFRLIPLPERFQAEVRQLFSADVIAPTNPLDLGTIFDFQLYTRIVERSLRAVAPHALLLVHTYGPGPEAVASHGLAQRVAEISRGLDKPIAFCAFAQQEDLKRLREDAPLPIFTNIEGAVRALAASRDRHASQARLIPLPSPPSERPDKVEALLGGPRVLSASAALDLCESFDIPAATWAVVDEAEAALVAAAAIGYPVALKGLVADVSHKSDAGLVVLGIRDDESLQAAFAKVWSTMARCAPPAQVRRIMVQEMVPPGFEVIIGGKRDPSFGPVVMFGLGGIYVEILDDVAFRLAPLAPDQAESMIDEVRGSRMLQGLRGQPPVDRPAVVKALLAVSRLLVECPEVLEIDVNPLMALEHGAAAIDARVVLEGQRT